MNRKNKKMTCLFLLSSSFLLFTISCSTLKNISSWRELLGSRKTETGIRAQPYRGNLDSHYLLASYYQERGKDKEAIEEFEKVLLIDPNYVKAYNGMGISYDHLGDFPRAIALYKKTLSLNPNLDYVQNNLGYSYLLQGSLDEAIDAFKKAIELNDQDRRFHNNLGLGYAMKGQFDPALIEFKLAGDEAKAHYNVAQFYYKRELYREAETHYTIALTLDPSFARARTGIEAANAMARIFQPAIPNAPSPALARNDEMNPSTEKAKEKGLLIQDQHPEEKAPNPMKSDAIEISNGNGVNRMATRISNYLKGKGLKVIQLTNADRFNYIKTKIFYQKGHFEEAKYVAAMIPGTQSIEELKKFARSATEIKVLLGKDLIPQSKVFGNYSGV